jgi:hypothetical protein
LRINPKAWVRLTIVENLVNETGTLVRLPNHPAPVSVNVQEEAIMAKGLPPRRRDLALGSGAEL